MLLPKIEYRAQTTVLTINEATKIFGPFKKLFKQKLEIVGTFPDVGLYCKQYYDLFNLYNHLARTMITNLYNTLNNTNDKANIINNRLIKLQRDMWVPFSPLKIKD